jgi:dephospho-CoA kinase
VKLFGLTGGIGAGKSTAGEILAARGIPVIDTDIIARQVVEPGEPAWKEIGELFGSAVLESDGRLHRRRLAEIVFANPDKRKQLEGIVHPRIRENWRKQTEDLRRSGTRAAIVIIPLLFETDAASHFDRVICLGCSIPTQQARLLARGWSAEHIKYRLGAQWPLEKKLLLSDYVVWTEGGKELQVAQLDRILQSENLG